MPQELQINQVLREATRRGASDVHFHVGKPPTLRLNGDLVELETVDLDQDLLTVLVRSIAPEQALLDIADPKKRGADFAYVLEGKIRFRCALLNDAGDLALVMRRLPSRILTPQQIGFPERVLELVKRPRGLFLVTGPTGSGKTTTQASLVDYLLSLAAGLHIITIEEPTEYRLKQRPKSIVTQREVPTDVPTFDEGLRQALRQDPDVIVVGEMRELETMRTALAAAETGHLVFGTLHTTSAAKTIDRLVGKFPGNEEDQVRSQISTSMLGVLCQQLVPTADNKGVVAAFEFMEATPAIANLIRIGKTEQIESAIKTSGRNFGMQLLDDHLFALVQSGRIHMDEAVRVSTNPDQLRLRLRGA